MFSVPSMRIAHRITAVTKTTDAPSLSWNVTMVMVMGTVLRGLFRTGL